MLDNKSFIVTVLVFVLTLAVVIPAKAQYSVNYDYQTIAAMVAAYGTEAATETMYQQNTSKIAEAYGYSEVATAGIFASKLLDRNALKSSQGFGNPDENYYYRKIYNLVANKIIPKTISVTKKVIKDPGTALYWGTYLYKTMSDTKSLCNQFSSVVTNSTLSFEDINFLEFTSDLARIFNLGDVSGLQNTLLNLADIGMNFNTDNLESEFNNLQDMAVGLANAGISSTDSIFNGSAFHGTFNQKVGTIQNMVEHNTTLWNNLQSGINNALAPFEGGDLDDITSVLTTHNGSNDGWISSYSSGSDAQYYKQRVYIYHIDSGAETVCNYEPPTDNDAILYGDHWYRINTTDPNFYPNSDQREDALRNSEAHAGWSRSKVNQLNNSNDGYNYYINYWSLAYILTKSKSGQYAKAYAYSITVTRNWYNTETFYEDIFDSYSMDWTTFMNVMQAKLEDANRNEEGKVYQIGYDNKIYYTASNERKLKGATQANFVTQCNGYGKMIEGSIQYKCRKCGGSPNEHTKQCSMATTLTEGADYSDINEAIESRKSQMASLRAEIDRLNALNREILSRLNTASAEEAIQLRKEYNDNKDWITKLQRDYDTLQDEVNQLNQAKQEAIDFENNQSDDNNRIPNVMHAIQGNFQLEWIDEGHWEGYTFIRKANMRNMKSVVTFRAKVSISRGPKYFLGIKIHRAIVLIAWELTAEYSDSEVIETMVLNPNTTAQVQNAMVNQRLHELQQLYPDCAVNVEYEYAPGLAEETDDDDSVHLLWASDRLDVARDICHRLEKIYVDLVVVDKYLHYKFNILSWLQDQTLGHLNTERGRRLSIAERSRRRWMHNGGSALFQREEEDDEYEE